MIKSEWHSLLHNKLLLVVLAAIIAIPTIYAGLFLDSMWDPYGNVDKLPVAIVNHDQPVEYEGTTLQVGDDMIQELKKNDSLQFNFVDEQTAKDGLRHGSYYMVVTIPDNFSKNASTIMEDNPEKMELKYETNPGTNYIASKMSETALLKIKDKVCDSITETYAKTVFDKIEEIGNGMDEAADGAGKLKDGVKKASDGSAEITKNLAALASSTVTFTEGAKDLQGGIKEYTGGTDKLNNSSPALIKGVSSLKKGASDLSSGASDLNKGTKAYVTGASSLAAGAAAYVQGVGQLAAGAKQLAPLEDGLGSAYAGIQQLHAAVSINNYDGKESVCLTTGTKALLAGLNHMQQIVNALPNGASAAQTSRQTDKVSIEAANELQKQVSAANTNLAASAEDANNQIESANKQIKNAKEQIKDRNDSIKDANSQLDSAEDTLNSQIDKAIGVLQSAQKAAKEKGEELDLSGQIDKLNAIKEDSPARLDTISSIETEKVDKIKAAAVSIDAGALQANAASLPYSASDPSNPIETLKSSVGALTAAAAKVNEGAQQVSQGLSALETATAAFPEAGEGIAALNQGFSTLTSNNKKLSAGAAEITKQGKNLTAGAKKVSKGSFQLSAGTKTLKKGANQLAAGTKKLTSNNKTLNSGAASLSEGAAKIQDGSERLRDGSQELDHGMASLSDGSEELKTALADGAKEVNGSKAEDSNIEMFAAPVDDAESMLTTVENNGHAMAPYMMSVGLWVGCLAFCLIYPLMKYEGKLESGLAWWASKASVLYPVAFLQGLALILLLHFTIGFTPAQMGKTIAFACLTAVTFTSIMYFFNITLGKVGSFLMLIFMVVQLAGSAGTYPVEISPAFVSKIHWYLPFTYTVNAFRSAIAGGESIRSAVIVMSILFILFTALTVISFQIKTARRQKGKPVLFDWLEEKGLA